MKGDCFREFMVDREGVVEIQANRAIGHADAAQILNDLKATGKSVAPLISLGASRLELRRVVRS